MQNSKTTEAYDPSILKKQGEEQRLEYFMGIEEDKQADTEQKE